MSQDTLGAPAPVSPETIPMVVYRGQLILTTDMLARLYGTAEDNIYDNYRRNADRFEEGKHFYKLKGQALREFISLQPANSRSQISSKIRNLILWTERGAARHAKMLDTDQAWEVFEKLEDCYFGKKEAAQPQAKALPPAIPAEGRINDRIFTDLDYSLEAARAASQFIQDCLAAAKSGGPLPNVDELRDKIADGLCCYALHNRRYLVSFSKPFELTPLPAGAEIVNPQDAKDMAAFVDGMVPVSLIPEIVNQCVRRLAKG